MSENTNNTGVGKCTLTYLSAAALAAQRRVARLELALAPPAARVLRLALRALRALRSLRDTNTHISVSRVLVRHVYAYLLGGAGLAEQHVLLQLALAPAVDLVSGLAALARRPLRSLRDMRSVTSDENDSVVSHSVVRHAYTYLLLAAGHAEQRVLHQLALAPRADLVGGLAAVVARRALRSLRGRQRVTSSMIQIPW